MMRSSALCALSRVTGESRPCPLAIDLRIHNEWSNVARMRGVVKHCMEAAFAGCRVSEPLAMVTSELLENAIKYGVWNDDEPRLIRLRMCGAKDAVAVTVDSPAMADSAATVKETLARINHFDSPRAAYVARLGEIAGADTHEAGKLGLLRIAYEANCTLSAELDDRGVLSVTAVRSNPCVIGRDPEY